LAADVKPIEAAAGETGFGRQTFDRCRTIADRSRVDPLTAGIVIVAFDEARCEQEASFIDLELATDSAEFATVRRARRSTAL
jgi:hypothetical protein